MNTLASRFATTFATAALLLGATTADAAVHTLTRTGKIIANVPGGLPALDDFAIGQTINWRVTYDDADVTFPGTITRPSNGLKVTNPDISIVGLGNGNPANSVAITVGSHSFELADQICYQDAACIAARRLDFPAGPTLMFYKGRLLGLDSCLIEGGGGFGAGITLCQLTLASLTPPLQAVYKAGLGYTRTDIFTIRAANLRQAFYAQFDGPGFANAVPEPATWAMMIMGFGLVGAAARRRTAQARAA